MGYNEISSKIKTKGLTFPSFSAVFIHTFTLDDGWRFTLPESAYLADYQGRLEDLIVDSKAGGKNPGRVFSISESVKKDIVYMEPNVETQVFSSREFSDDILMRCSMRGFDFRIPVRADVDEDENGNVVPDFESVDFEGHANVEVSVFFQKIVSVTYRFLFDGITCRTLVAEEDNLDSPCSQAMPAKEPTVDHLIALLATYLGAEYWSVDDFAGDSTGTIDLKNRLIVSNMPLRRTPGPWILDEGDRVFDEVALAYKSFIVNNCTSPDNPLEPAPRKDVTVAEDSRYAMVDIWENLKHDYFNGEKVCDLFGATHEPKLSEAGIIDHIRYNHREELVGLMTLYPAEWPYRTAEAFDEVCGPNVAIDSDDLVLVGSHMAVVIGTYARRGGGNGSVNWKKLMGERKMYHVSWSEYLLILQFVLAKKHTVNHAIDTMIEVAMKAKSGTDKELIGKSAKSVLAMSRKVMQLDVIKHAKFPSHKVMYDRTAKRLGVEDDFARLHEMFSMMNDNLQGLSDYEAVKSDSMMNNLLIAISVVSIFELVFQEDELPFVERFFNADLGWLTAVMSMLCAALAVIALGTLFWRTKFCKKIVKLFKTNG